MELLRAQEEAEAQRQQELLEAVCATGTPVVLLISAGRPIVVFWENTTTGEIKFNGQYNMNNDKSNENVFGFDRDKWPNTECWEFSNNTSDRTLFKKSEWLEEVYDKEEDAMVPAWMSDFEARYPDLDDPYRDYT